MKKKLLIIGVFATVSIFANTLTMQESIDKTMANHPDIKSLVLGVKQSKEEYNSAFADYLPQVELQAQYNPVQTFVMPSNGYFHTIDDDGWSAGASLKQKIWDFSKTSSAVNASKLDEEISKLSLKEIKALIAYKVKSLYKTMIVQKEAVEVRKKDLQTKVAYYEQAKALVKQGLKTEADASRFLSSVYAAKDELAIAKSLYEKAKISLSLYMGENIEDGVELEYGLLKQKYNFDEDIQKEVLDNNYQLKIKSQNIDKNMLIYKSTKASHYGSIDAVASYNHFDTLNRYDSKLVGISLSVPLYSGGRVSAQTQKARIGMQIAKEQKASNLLALKDEMSGLLVDIKRYNKTIEAKKAQIVAAQKTKNVLQARYEEGLTTYIEVLDAVSVELNAKLGLLQAYYLKSRAIDSLEYLKGKI